MRSLAKILILSGMLAVGPWVVAQTAQYPFQNPALPVAQRVDDLVNRLTLDEKISQMPLTAAAIPRLGIPEYTWWNEGLHGVARSGYATVFPQAIGLAATWDTDLIHRVGETISTEARAKYNDAVAHGNHRIYFGLTIWSPNINIFRDPRWGRGQETYGEDPYLTSRIGLAFVTGLQGGDPAHPRVISTPKHFAVHSGPESTRHTADVHPSPLDLEATYLPAFRATLVEGKADSTMCAYNAVDGAPACANDMLLKTTLRQDWGFKGFVTSDCWAVTDIWQGHKYAPDEEHAAAAALRAGTDTSCGGEFNALRKAVDDKLVTEGEIDTAVKRLFTARFELGMFDPPQSTQFGRIPFSENDSEAHRTLSRQVARASMVLLKNSNGALPLGNNAHTIAVVGPNAVSLAAIEGNYNAIPSHPVLPLDGMESVFGRRAKVLFAQGSSYVAGASVTVPRTAFRNGGEEGLKGEYFSNTNWQGQPAATRSDKEIDFDWDAASPMPGVPLTAFSVRWTGTIAAPGAGDYVFHLAIKPCNNREENQNEVESYHFYLDGKLTAEGQCNRRQGEVKQPLAVHFSGSQPRQFSLDYAHSAPMFGAGIHFEWEPDAAAMRDEAVETARKADVVVAFLGLSPRLEGEEMPVKLDGFSGGDRTRIDLPQLQEQLLEALGQTGKPLVVVLMNGSALSVPWAKEHAAAILEAWYPGEEGGTAIAETLSGENNPGGRLPVTFYASTDDLPSFADYSMAGRTYRYFSGQPLYGFGYGLSYTTFAYKNIRLSSPTVHAGDSLTVDADVTNTGKHSGQEVAELYLRGPRTQGAELRSLRSFDRVTLAAGETRHLSFALDPRRLSEVDESGKRSVSPGSYTVFVGGGQPGEAEGVQADFTIEGTQSLPR
ncbi:MAG TPA: glycoside hydrolase family 3 C-terminal domain-containing protein [Acidobacteriaceae bacterium]|nr:glycoside hydrolase family 3 C-terminal domain-containing protein [Acidobacteriaceae bacterium]